MGKLLEGRSSQHDVRTGSHPGISYSELFIPGNPNLSQKGEIKFRDLIIDHACILIPDAEPASFAAIQQAAHDHIFDLVRYSCLLGANPANTSVNMNENDSDFLQGRCSRILRWMKHLSNSAAQSEYSISRTTLEYMSTVYGVLLKNITSNFKVDLVSSAPNLDLEEVYQKLGLVGLRLGTTVCLGDLELTGHESTRGYGIIHDYFTNRISTVI